MIRYLSFLALLLPAPLLAVLQIRPYVIGLPDPDPSVRDTDPNPLVRDTDPDQSIRKKNIESYCFMTSYDFLSFKNYLMSLQKEVSKKTFFF